MACVAVMTEAFTALMMIFYGADDDDDAGWWCIGVGVVWRGSDGIIIVCMAWYWLTIIMCVW
jgi:hypothetical protein